MMMEELNKIFKKEFGRDMTLAEGWKMVEFVSMVLENADKNIDEAIANIQNTNGR